MERKAQKERSGSSPKDTWLGAVEPGSNSSLTTTKIYTLWHVNSEATERRAHGDPKGICWFCFSQLWSTLDFALPSFWAVEGPGWSWMAQLRYGLSSSSKKENLTCKQHLSLKFAYISNTPTNFKVPEGKRQSLHSFHMASQCLRCGNLTNYFQMSKYIGSVLSFLNDSTPLRQKAA